MSIRESFQRPVRALWRGLRFVIHVKRFDVWRRRLDVTMPQVAPGLRVESRLATKEDSPFYEGIVPDGKRAELKNRFSRRRRCVLGPVGDLLVFHVWFSIGSQYPANLNRALNPGSGYAYLFELLTIKEYRGKRIREAGWSLA